jgi:hypothetical protein
MNPAESDCDALAKGDEVLTGLGVEEIHSNHGKRAQSLRNQAATARDALSAAEEEEAFKESLTLPTPPIPPRNPARLLRGKVPEETVREVSYIWQRRQNRRQQLAAGSNRRIPIGELSTTTPGYTSTIAEPSKTTNEIHSISEKDEIQVTKKLNDTRDKKIEGHESTKDHSVGLGISMEKPLNPAEGDNKTKEIKSNAIEGQGNQANKTMGAASQAEERLSLLAQVIANGGGITEPMLNISQYNDIGLGINIYGLSKPFGHSDGKEQHYEQDVGEDLEALVYILLTAHEIERAERAKAEALRVAQSEQAVAAKEVTDAIGSTELVGESHAMEATGDSPAVLSGPENAREISIVETTVAAEKLTTDHSAIADEVDPENIAGGAKHIVEAEVVEESRVESRVDAQLLVSARAGEIKPTAPLSVAIGVAELRDVGASSTASANVEQQPALTTDPVNNDAFIDELLEINYRGQAESFNRKHSSASAVRSRSNLSGIASTSLRATSNSSVPVLNPTPSIFAEDLTQRLRSLRTPGASNKIIVKPFAVRHGGEARTTSGVQPGNQAPPPSPHVTYFHRFYAVPDDNKHLSVKKTRPQPINLPEPSRRGLFYFTEGERKYIKQLVHAEPRGCKEHPNCTECYNTEYAYIENKVMPTSIPPEERNRIISNNRSLRNIKNVCVNVRQSLS